MIKPQIEWIQRENEELKQRFQDQGLDITRIWIPSPENLELENAELTAIDRWVEAYRKTPDRRAMEKRGFRFPPIEQACSPDNDWFLFERWMRKEPLSWNYAERFGGLPSPDDWPDEKVAQELDLALSRLFEQGILLEVHEDVPSRVTYNFLRELLPGEQFEYLPDNSFINLGCSGWCPECFQQPWCEVARDLAEDPLD